MENNWKIDVLSLILCYVCLLFVEMDCEDFELLGENCFEIIDWS